MSGSAREPVNMACPKCGGSMHSFQRSQLFVDQCEECRGFFLDHGELEGLIDAEGGGWSGQIGPPAGVTDAASALGGAAMDAARLHLSRRSGMREER